MDDPVLTPENDVFWLQRAGTILTDTVDQLDKGARQIAVAMAWFWTVYSAVALVVATGNRFDTNGNVVVVVIPAILIFTAYLAATFATLPISVEFDDRAPNQIKAAHDLAVRKRRHRLTASACCAAVAALSVIVAVAVAAASRNQTHEDVAVIGLSEDGARVLIGGRLTEVDQVTVRLADEKGLQAERVVPVVESAYDTALPLASPGTYEVSVRWTKGELHYSVVEEVDKR